LVATLVSLASVASAGPIRPTIAFDRSLVDEKYAGMASLRVAGRVTVPTDATVEIRTYYVRDDGGLVPAGGADIPLKPDGSFECSLRPASPGWRSGTLRVLATLAGMRHIRAQRDIPVVAPGDPPREQIIYEPPSSGVTVDLDNPPKATLLPRGERFLITGSTREEAPRSGILKLVRTDGPRGEVIHESIDITFPLRGEQGDRRRWFETEFRASKDDGRYELQLEQFGRGEGRTILRIPVAITDPIALAPLEAPRR
jgi:hypothetical protein